MGNGFVEGFNRTEKSSSILWWIPGIFVLLLALLFLAGKWAVRKIRS